MSVVIKLCIYELFGVCWKIVACLEKLFPSSCHGWIRAALGEEILLGGGENKWCSHAWKWLVKGISAVDDDYGELNELCWNGYNWCFICPIKEPLILA